MAYDHFQSRIYQLCLTLGLTREEAQEVIQETFLSIWQQRHKLRVEGSLAGLIFTIAKRLVIKLIRDKIRLKQYQDQEITSPVNQTEEYVIFMDLQAQAQEGIEKLPAKRKHIYMLSKELGLSNEEIANKLNLSKRTIENQLYRATQHLRQYLDDKKLLIALWLTIFLK